MRLSETLGLLFPDVYVYRFFFKTMCHQSRGKVLELGCANGNNLMVFYHFGWNCVGLDISQESIDRAEFNFSSQGITDCDYRFIQRDLTDGLGESISDQFDVVLLPNMLYYLPREAAQSLLTDLRKVVRPGTLVFISMRTLRDYRYGRGEKIGRNAFRLTIDETGERGLTNVFYTEHEVVDMLRSFLSVAPETIEVFNLDYQNLQQGVVTSNSEVIIWGTVSE